MTPSSIRARKRPDPVIDTCGLVVIDAVAEFVVVVEKYTQHPENIFKRSVIHRSVDGYNGFLMTDQAAVDRATREGGIRLTETDLENPF